MSNNTEILTAALDYANRGFHVFPVHGIVNGKCTCGFPGCKPPNSGKHPATKSGLKDATTDAAIIRAWFERNNWNVAIRTGAESRIWVLDIDGAQGEESLDNLEKIHGKLPPTMESTTGRGRHLIWKHTGEELKNSASKIGLKIDARGDGGYIVAPPSNHHSGAVYTLNDAEAVYAPDWLFDLASGAKAKAERVYAVPDAGQQTGEWDVADVRNMLSALDPDMEYMEWVRVGMALHEGNYSVLLWDEWSRSGKKYQSGDCVKRWRGFTPGGGVSMGTLVAKAQDYGWTPRRAEEDTVATEIAARIHARFVAKGKKAVALKVAAPLEVIKAFPNPVEVGGIVGDTVKWILETAIKPQPELALLHVITALGAVFGRRYKCQGIYESRPNIYTIGIAGSGSGKEHSRKQMSVIMNQAGLGEFIGGDRFRSDAGLVVSLQKNPSQIMPIDEIGLILQLMADKKAAGFQKNIATNLLTLYSASGGFFNAGQYADEEKDPVILKYPNLCIYGTTTKENYVKALTSDAVTDGQLNRFIVVPSGNEFPDRNENDNREIVPPHGLLRQWESLAPPKDALPNIDLIVPTAIIVVWGNDVGLRLKNMGDIEDKRARENAFGVGRLWNRYRDSVQKISMIFAIARNQARPEITSADLDIAEGIVTRSVEYMTELCLDSIADSEFQRHCQKVIAILKVEKEITQSALCNSCRFLKSKDLKEILDSLVEQERIEILTDTDTTKKRRAKIIRLK